MAYEDFRRGERRYESRNPRQSYERSYGERDRYQQSERDDWRDDHQGGYQGGGGYASRQRDYGEEGRFRGSQRASSGGEYVGNRAPEYWPQRYDPESYIDEGYGENRGMSDWRTEEGLFGESRNRGALDSDYRRHYGTGEYGSGSSSYGRRGAFGSGSQPYRGEHAGKGPKGYRRSDDRIREDVCDLLTDDPRLDASGFEVAVKECEVTLSGTVASRRDKRLAEELAENVPGVRDVHNTLRVSSEQSTQQTSGTQGKEQPGGTATSSRH